jgi:hypothetical protein
VILLKYQLIKSIKNNSSGKVKCMKKVFLSCIFVIAFAFIFNSGVLATRFMGDDSENHAKNFLKMYGSYEKIQNEKELYNLNNELEAVVFDVISEEGSGYIIVNLNDMSIPEFSFKNLNPYDKVKNSKCFYNGALEYYFLNGEKICDIKNGMEIGNDKKHIYHRAKKLNLDVVNNNVENVISRRPTNRYTEVDGSLKKWDTDHYCGVDAMAILLMYFDDYYEDDFVDRELEDDDELTDYLIENEYIKDAGTRARELEKGLESYIEDQEYEDDYSVNSRSYDFYKLTRKIDKNKPVIVGVLESSSYFSANHWVIAYGYVENDDGDDYIVVNDGHRHDDVYLLDDRDYYDYMVYIY